MKLFGLILMCVVMWVMGAYVCTGMALSHAERKGKNKAACAISAIFAYIFFSGLGLYVFG